MRADKSRSSKTPPVEPQQRLRVHRPLPMLPACLVPIFRRPFNNHPQILPSDLTRIRYCRTLDRATREHLCGLIRARVKQAMISHRLPTAPLKLLLPDDFPDLVQHWPPRVRAYVSRADLVTQPSRAVQLSPRDIAKLGANAPEAYIDMLLRLEAWGSKIDSKVVPGPGATAARRVPALVQEVYNQLKRLEETPDSSLIARADTSLAGLWPEFAKNADTLADLIGLALTCSDPCFMPDEDLRRVLACQALLGALQRLRYGTMEFRIASFALPQGEERGDFLGDLATDRNLAAVRRIARVLAYRNGLVFIDDLARSASQYCGTELRREQATAIVAATTRVRWVSKRAGWFTFRGPSRLRRGIAKGLVLAGRPQRLADLLEHWAPWSGKEHFPYTIPPLPVVARLCAMYEDLHIDKQHFLRFAPKRLPREILNAAEAAIYQHILNKGGLMRMDELRSFAQNGATVPADAALAVLDRSPFVERLENGLCRLRRRTLRAAKVARALASHRRAPATGYFVPDH